MREPMRPQAPHDPAVELVEESADVSALVIFAPATQDRVDLLYQLRCRYRRAATRQPSNLVLEVPDRFLSRIRVQRPRFMASFDLTARQPHRPAATFDLKAQKLKSLPDVHDPRFARIEAHTQLLKYSTRRFQCRSRLGSRRTGNTPIVCVPCELISPATHLPIKGRQENVTEQRRNNPALRHATFRRKESTFSPDTGFEYVLDEAQHSTVRYLLGYQC